MPKTYNSLYNRIYDFSNLHSAYLKARKGKRYQSEVLEFSCNIEENLLKLQKELKGNTYKTGLYKEFYVYEPKKRLVKALPFKDRVVHHALCNIIEPIFDSVFIYDSYACRNGKGTHRGVGRLVYFLRKLSRSGKRVYCLKADISKYFPSINHGILLNIIAKKLKCRYTMNLIEDIVHSSKNFKDSEVVDLPIGNLTSQLFANIYLNELDYFVKHGLKCGYYLRYVDDFVILDTDKRKLKKIKDDIGCFLRDNLNLKLNPKTAVFPVSLGIDFLGYRLWRTHVLLRKNSIKRMKRKLKNFMELYRDGAVGLNNIRQSIASWLGHAAHADTYNLRKKIFGEFKLMNNLTV